MLRLKIAGIKSSPPAILNPETKKHVASFTGLAAALQVMPYYRVYLFDKAN